MLHAWELRADGMLCPGDLSLIMAQNRYSQVANRHPRFASQFIGGYIASNNPGGWTVLNETCKSLTFLLTDILPVFGASSAGAVLAFYLNYLYQRKIRQEEEINKSREFMAKLYVIAHAALQYTLNYLTNREVSWQNLPAHADLVPNESILGVKDIAFYCSLCPLG
jgi:hypothetical protein